MQTQEVVIGYLVELEEENLLSFCLDVIKMENKKCPNYGNELTKLIAGSSLNYECKHCGYAYRTTIVEGIE